VFALALCSFGCSQQQPRWEYRVATVENFSHDYEDDLKKKSVPMEDVIDISRMGPGSFVAIESQLDPAGKAGWELVSVVPQIETLHSSRTPDKQNIRTARLILFFKRPVQK
jgi:hypothetical protein